MRSASDPVAAFSAAEQAVFETLRTPGAIQTFLDGIPYSTDKCYRAPRTVLRDRKAHCFDGAVFAAAALERLGQAPCLLDMRAYRDDDHVIAVYRRDGHFGAVAKSNFVGLRSREPIYRNLRELALSYFEVYYNMERDKSLRAYSRLVDLRRCGVPDWRTADAAMDVIAARLDRARHVPLLTVSQEAQLLPIDERTFQAGQLGADVNGIYFAEPRSRG